jgi:ribosome biogenesis protein BMS1
MQLVYGESTNNSTSMDEENDSSEDEENGDFFIPKEEVKKVSISSPLLTCTTCM